MANAPSADVRLAATLLLAAVAITVARTLYVWYIALRNAPTPGFLFPYFLFATITATWILLARFIWKSQNWARVVNTVFVALSVVHLLWTIYQILTFPGGTGFMWSFVTSITTAALRVYATILLFQPATNAFFTRH